jgi:NAD-dependent oxidoreductase involved in siderophore biosynthesis
MGARSKKQMADKDIPAYRCTSCLQAIPEDQNRNVIAMYGLQPQSDDARNFVYEAQNLTHYANAVAQACYVSNQEMSDDALFWLHQLLDQLTEETNRRLERAQEALGIVWKREQEAKKARPTREGMGA